MRKIFPAGIVLLFLITACAPAIEENDDLLLNLLRSDPEHFQHYVTNKDELEIQIIYTRIDRDANNRPVFRSFYFNADSLCYFYPASTVKFPMVLMALEKINKLGVPGLNKYTTMLHDSLYEGQFSVRADTTSESCLPSLAHYVKKILVTSDNDAHNRLYEFMGQQAANDVMHGKGFRARYLARVDRALPPAQNRHTEGVRFLRDTAEIFRQPMLVADSMVVSDYVAKGYAFYRHDSLICEAMDFSYKNFLPLTTQHQVLRTFLFPESVPARQRFDLTTDDRNFVLQYMSQLPTETWFPPYARDSVYYPAYGKFLLFGNDRAAIPSNIRIFNKIGDAYGYMIDNAYIVDFENKVEFMLSAVIATNTDGVYNDEKYEYEKLGFPFMKNLGKLIYHYELKRKRPRSPDLSDFKMTYEPRPKEDVGL